MIKTAQNIIGKSPQADCKSLYKSCESLNVSNSSGSKPFPFKAVFPLLRPSPFNLFQFIFSKIKKYSATNICYSKCSYFGTAGIALKLIIQALSPNLDILSHALVYHDAIMDNQRFIMISSIVLLSDILDVQLLRSTQFQLPNGICPTEPSVWN